MAELAARQHGVVSRHQLRRLGVTDSSVARAIATGRLHPVFRGVVAVGHPCIGERGRMLAAVLACDKGTVVSHRTAAALLGLLDRAPAAVEVIAPAQSGRGIDQIRRHYVPLPKSDEIGTHAGIPCTGPSRTLVDLAGILGERSLRRVVEQAAALGILDVAATERAMASDRRRGAPALRAILRDWRAATEQGAAKGVAHKPRLRSPLEARLLALIGGGGLPAPLCNQEIDVGDRLEVDFLWPEQRLVVETDGRRYHDNPAAFERDRQRDRALHLGGYRILRVTWAQVAQEPNAVISAIRRLLDVDRPAVSAPHHPTRFNRSDRLR